MSFSINQDIRSVTDLKRNTKGILKQIHETGRPVVITVNGKPDCVIVDSKIYEEQIRAQNLANLLALAEKDVEQGRTRPMRGFLKDLKNGKTLSR